jgi:ATP-dependent DNA helicase RecQ
VSTPSPAHLLQSVFGFPGFRGGQEAVVSRLLAGRSTLAIFPTGAGKSLCYQLPALMFEGLTLVISPLIALMKDQLDFLTRHGVAAARIDSTLGAEELQRIQAQLRAGTLKLLYVAPERLGNERFVQLLRGVRLSLLAVDEAHCISEWGHNFRPDYMKLAPLARSLGVERVLALTATATPSVARDIAAAFGIAHEDLVQTGFHRENLTLHLTPTPGGEARWNGLLSRLRTRPRGPTIVYVTLQRTAEALARFLVGHGLPAQAYHAGLEPETRSRVQDDFMGSSDAIVVATIAFGMGIDKRDIRAVYHCNLPKSLENYAQEIGRAGRDGERSDCEVLAAREDLTVLENFTFGDTPTPEAVAGVLEHVLGQGPLFDVSVYELSGAHDVRPLVVETLLTYLELDGLLVATGPFYTAYKFQLLRPLDEVLAGFDAGRADFLRRLFAQAQAKRIWSELELDAATQATGEPRARIVAALNYLEEQGALKLQVSGLRQGYRLTRTDFDRAALIHGLGERFAERERRDLQRLRQVLDFVEHTGCRTRLLLAYFGEALPADCGHCDVCAGEPPGPLPAPARRARASVDLEALEALRTRHPEALGAPRQRARFLCGITSPGTTRARLTRHPLFGALSELPFQDVLARVGV